MYLSDLLYINKFGLPPCAICQVNRNVDDEECLPLVSVSRGCRSSFVVENHVHINKTVDLKTEIFRLPPEMSSLRSQPVTNYFNSGVIFSRKILTQEFLTCQSFNPGNGVGEGGE